MDDTAYSVRPTDHGAFQVVRDQLVPHATFATLSEAQRICDRLNAAPTPAPDRPTLRDRFAMAALTGLVPGSIGLTADRATTIARAAYQMADAMLKARG